MNATIMTVAQLAAIKAAKRDIQAQGGKPAYLALACRSRNTSAPWRVFNPSRKDTQWGTRKLKRDQ
jgi:hypothetical protein